MLHRPCRRVFFAAALFMALSAAMAQTHSYRYSLDTRSNEPQFAKEIPSVSDGRRFDVELDHQGRVARYAFYQDGSKVSEYVYHFPAGSGRSNSVDIYRNGELITTTRIQRNPQGDPIQLDYLTLQGVRTSYRTRSYSGNQVEITRYNAEGAPTDRSTSFFSPEGLLIKTVGHPDENTSIETTFDPNTGQAQDKKQFDKGVLSNTSRFTYDNTGGLLREDIYAPNGTWYSASEYKQGLKTREIYKFSNGETQETRVTYDSKRIATEATFVRNDKLICTFKYDRFPNGSIHRTLAVGPNGDLYAEYPDHYVDTVNRDGTSLSEIKGAIIHKQGNWW